MNTLFIELIKNDILLLFSSVNWNTWKRLKDRLCNGEYIENFKTLQDAKKACDKSLDCGCISALTGDAFLTAKGTRTMRHEGGTAYVRRDGTKGIHSNILILKS